MMLTVNTLAIAAIRAGRRVAEMWKANPLTLCDECNVRIDAFIRRIEAGRVCRDSDDETVVMMLKAIGEMLDTVSPGYADVFQTRGTEDFPFIDQHCEDVRRFGEALKTFMRARNAVIDAVRVYREVAHVIQERKIDSVVAWD